MMKKFNWRTLVAFAVIIAMTYFGIVLMEDSWCEWMSGVIWIIGEMLIVGLLIWKELIAFYKNLF